MGRGWGLRGGGGGPKFDARKKYSISILPSGWVDQGWRPERMKSPSLSQSSVFVFVVQKTIMKQINSIFLQTKTTATTQCFSCFI